MKLLTYLQTTQGLSRRAITALIQRGEIMLNGVIVQSFATPVCGGETLQIAGKSSQIDLEKPAEKRDTLVLFHKPIGYVVSRADPHNATIFELLPAGREKYYYPIGRLDKDSSGLVILSTDPALVHSLLHPSKKLEKVYEVLVKQERDHELLPVVKAGILLDEHGLPAKNAEDGELLKVIKLYAKRLPTGPTLLTITLHEGKKRHIRRLLKYLRYTIISLKRVSFGTWKLDDLAEGARKPAN